MGLVYLGRDAGGRVVAVKVVRGEHAQNPRLTPSPDHGPGLAPMAEPARTRLVAAPFRRRTRPLAPPSGPPGRLVPVVLDVRERARHIRFRDGGDCRNIGRLLPSVLP